MSTSRVKSALCSVVGVALIAAAVLAMMGFLPLQPEKTKVDLSEQSSVNAICELATLRSYYHNVAMYEKNPDPLFQYGLGRYGYKRMWLEYSGIVELVVDAGQIRIGEPDKDGVVNAYIPDAVVKNVTAEKDSLSEPLTETGMFTTITAEDKADAFSEAQKSMKEEAEQDRMLLNRAKDNAQKLLEQYIVNTGREMGKTYTVRWVNQADQV